jgi:hypothetical protein
MWSWLIALLFLCQSSKESERAETRAASEFGDRFIRPADVVVRGKIASVQRLPGREVWIVRLEASEVYKGEPPGDAVVLLADSQEAFRVDDQVEHVVFAKLYREGSSFHVSIGQFASRDPAWQEKLSQLTFLLQLESSEEPLAARRQKLLARLLEQLEHAPAWTRSNGVRELAYLAEASPEIFAAPERERLERSTRREKDPRRRRDLQEVLSLLAPR